MCFSLITKKKYMLIRGKRKIQKKIFSKVAFRIVFGTKQALNKIVSERGKKGKEMSRIGEL